MVFVLKLSRHEHAANLWKNIHDFTKGTESTSLWKDLASEYIEMWISIYNKKGIKITMGGVAKYVAAYCEECGEIPETDNTTHQKFSKEAFVDAIVEWMVADDQVCLLILWTK